MSVKRYDFGPIEPQDYESADGKYMLYADHEIEIFFARQHLGPEILEKKQEIATLSQQLATARAEIERLKPLANITVRINKARGENYASEFADTLESIDRNNEQPRSPNADG